LRREGASLLPDYKTVIFDEAHTVEDVAADHLGLQVSEGAIEYLFNKLYMPRQQKGILAANGDGTQGHSDAIGHHGNGHHGGNGRDHIEPIPSGVMTSSTNGHEDDGSNGRRAEAVVAVSVEGGNLGKGSGGSDGREGSPAKPGRARRAKSTATTNG
jgi:hypothetical protein